MFSLWNFQKEKKKRQSIFKVIMAESFLNLEWEIKIQKHEAQKTPNRLNLKRAPLKLIIIKLPKVKNKEINLKTTRVMWHVIYKGTSVRLCADFSTETFQVRKEWDDIFKILGGKNYKPKILYPANLSFRNEEKILSQTKAEGVYHH